MTRDMTKGPLLKELIFFTIPLIVGTLLQLTYNAVDSIMVGRYVGTGALAAVGTTNPLVTLVLLFTNGICLGAGILVGTLYGAKKIEQLQRQVSTGMIAGCVFAVAAAAIMMVLARPLLTLLQVETSILPEAIVYFRIVLAGLLFSFIYNYMAAMLRAMGDSASPLIFLGISAGLNIVGDFFFIARLKMGIEGAALSTIICEALSALLCLIYIHYRIPELRLGKRWLVFDRALLKSTLSYGFVSAMQQSTVQIGKLGIQTIVNTMGVDVTAAFNASNRFDDFAMVPQQNIAHAMTAVMAQNEGAAAVKRVKKSYYLGMAMEIVYGIFISLLTFFAAEPLMRLFTEDDGVIIEGVKYLHLIAFMYLLPGITNGIQGYFRGTGDLKVTLYSSMINMGARVAAAVILVFVLGMKYEAIPWSYLVGWAAMLLFELPYLLRRFSKMQ